MIIHCMHPQVLGAPKDCCRFRSLSTSVAGSNALWEKDNTFSANLSCPSLAAVKFTLQEDKGESPTCHVTLYSGLPWSVDSSSHNFIGLLTNISSGYQHVFFTSSTGSSEEQQPPTTLYIHVQVKSGLNPTLTLCTLLGPSLENLT